MISAAQTGIVTATSLNVRQGPSTSAERVMLNGHGVYLVKDQTVNILEVVGAWYYISMIFNGKTVKGYVLSEYIKLENSTAVSPAPTKAPSPTGKATPTPKATPTGKVTPTPKATLSPTPKPTATSNSIVKNFELKATVATTSLNVRSGAGTNFKIVSKITNGKSVTIINETIKENVKWYGITYLDGKKVLFGYVSSQYIKLNIKGTAVKGNVSSSTLKIRTSASSKAAYLKDVNKNIITLKKAKAVNIIEEKTVANNKWFRVSFSLSGKTYKGYVLAKDIEFRKMNTASSSTPTVKPTTKPTATPTPTKKVEKPSPTITPRPSGVTPTVGLSPTPKVTTTPNTATPKPTTKPAATPTPKPTTKPTATPTPAQLYYEVSDIQIHTNITSPTNGFVCNTIILSLVQNPMASLDLLYDRNNQPVTLKNGDRVTVYMTLNMGDVAWYFIILDNNTAGYVRAEYIYIGDTPPPVKAVSPTPTPIPIIGDPNNVDFELKMVLEGFPESYKPMLRNLNAKYPQWELKAYHTNLNWDAVIKAQSVPGKNTIPNSKSVEWKSLETGAYNWKTDTFIVFDGSTWVTASKAAIEYYMDPRNFLTENGIFQFELLRYQSAYQNKNGVENILSGTALFNKSYKYTDDSGQEKTISYGETFVKAAEYSGVSPYHLASRVKQEVVTGATTLSNSVSGTYPGFEGYYNFYNIGAFDSAGGGAIANGLNYAKNGSSNARTNELYMIPWTSPYRSIVGGSYFIGSSYINRGQDTVYLQKFNVTPTSTHFHQYMTNVEAPFAEAKKIFSAYRNMGSTPIVFSIPVYLNMPTQPVPIPVTQFNPNNRLKSLKVLSISGQEYTITPTFDQTEKNYYLIVPNSVNAVQIQATTVSKKAKLGLSGTVVLNVGDNRIVVPVIAENGDKAEYIVNVVREK